MRTFTKKQLDNYMGKDRAQTVVPLPDSGGTCVILSVIDGSALLDAEALHATSGVKGEAARQKNFCAFVLAQSIVDEDGKRLYTNEEAGLLLKMPLPAFQLVWPKCAKLNGLTEEAMKESAKKSVRAPASASSTVGPTTSAKPSGNSPIK